MIRKLFKGLLQSEADQKADLRRSLMLHEARIGGTLFGEVPAGHRREFFCLDKHTWVWHEEWKDENGQQKVVTTRYDVRPNGVLKSQNGSHYQQVSLDEAKHLAQAASLYSDRIRQEVYSYAF